MTTGDEELEKPVDNLFREVDDQFKDLEREYHLAREDLVTADVERREETMNPLEASNERYELLSRVASLEAEVSRQADELDERDRLLSQLGENIAGFEAALAQRDEMLVDLETAKHQAVEERREQSRLAALLDARAAERQELAEVAQRLQNERDHIQELLETSLQRFDEVDAVRIQMDDKLRHLEAARDTAAHEHDARAHELIESRAEMSKLAEQLDELSNAATAASAQAEKADALAERRANEAGYLNRRIDALNDKLEASSQFEAESTGLRRELNMSERRINELEREVATQQSEAAAAQAAVDAIADRTADYDELVVHVAQLTEQRDKAWKDASGHRATPEPAAPEVVSDEVAEVSALAGQARELAARRALEAEAAAQAAEVAAANAVVERRVEPVAAEVVELERVVEAEPAAQVIADPEPEPVVEAEPAAQLEDLDELDEDVIDADLSHLSRFSELVAEPAPEPQVEQELQAEPEPEPEPASEPIVAWAVAESGVTEFDGTETSGPAFFESDLAAFDVGNADVADTDLGDTDLADPEVVVSAVADTTADDAAAETAATETAAAETTAVETADLADDEVPPNPTSEIPAVTVPDDSADTAVLRDAPVLPDTALVEELAAIPALAVPPVVVLDPDDGLPPALLTEAVAVRKRLILPADLVPNTPDAVSYLLNQPGVTAIVDARSTCGRTGVRPSELFERVAALRDHFDVPVEVVVTPVSTPVGGAPDLPAIGVHHVTGADTVADRIRALCMGFPADQPLVVIAGDDHVRRAAIGEEANVVEPAAVLNLANG